MPCFILVHIQSRTFCKGFSNYLPFFLFGEGRWAFFVISLMFQDFIHSLYFFGIHFILPFDDHELIFLFGLVASILEYDFLFSLVLFCGVCFRSLFLSNFCSFRIILHILHIEFLPSYWPFPFRGRLLSGLVILLKSVEPSTGLYSCSPDPESRNPSFLVYSSFC